MNTVALGWVGTLNERTPFIIHAAVVGFVDPCLSRTRKPLRTNIRLKNLKTILAPAYALDLFFFRGFPKVWNFRFETVVPIARCTLKFCAGYVWNSI